MDGSSMTSLATEPTREALAELLVTTVTREHAFAPLRVEGALPPWLEGTLYRTGPAVFETFGTRVSHIFEADGGVSAVRFAQGGAEGAFRVVDSEGRKREQAAGKPLYGFALPWWRRMYNALTGKVKNTGNTSVMLHRGRLYTLMEGSVPTEIDRESLATLGESRLDGVVRGTFSAHPHRVPARACAYNFGVRYGRQTFLDVYALPDAAPASHLTAIPLPAPVMLHDFIATERHLVFFVSPLRVSIPRALLQIGGFGELFHYVKEAGTEVIVVPIDAPDGVRRFTVDAFYQWHFANAFESGDALVVDFVRYPDARTLWSLEGNDLGEGALVRARVGLTKDTLAMEVLDDVSGDFPLVDPRFACTAHDVVFRASSDARGTGVSRFDLRAGRATCFHDDATRHYSEPVFVPRGGDAREGEGVLLSLVLDGRTAQSHVAVLDAEHIEDGPVARAHFDHAIPMTFHGTFARA